MLSELLLVALVQVSSCIFSGSAPRENSLLPDIIFVPYKPRGLGIIIPKFRNIEQLNRFRYSKNNGPELTANMENSLLRWEFFDPKIQLKVGDFINYNTIIKGNRVELNGTFTGINIELVLAGLLGWTPHTGFYNVTTLYSLCEAIQFHTGHNTNYKENISIFEDDFSNGKLNRELWAVEHYIPQNSEENFEFVSYQDVEDCVFISNSRLYLKPIVLPNSQLQDILDLRDGCSRNTSQACLIGQIGANYLPPVKSGRIVSNFEFKYGKFEIRTKLPIGDWLFPEIELIPADLTKKYPKFLIAYSRGNKKLVTKEGREIGSNILFGGYVSSSDEMKQGDLKSMKLPPDVTNNMNVFTLMWTPEKVVLAINGEIYSTTYQSINENFRIALGVGVGGNVDFPDDAISGPYKKPWKNDAAKQVKDFVHAKNHWNSTWIGNNVALQVDSVKASCWYN